MSWLLASSAPSYADEQLSTHLSALSTLSLSPPTQLSASKRENKNKPRPSPALDSALSALYTSRPLVKSNVEDVLRGLVNAQKSMATAYGTEEVDEMVEAEVLGRAVILVWKEALEVLVNGAVAMEEERTWWDASLLGKRGVAIYLVQTLPLRLYSTLPPFSSISHLSLEAFKFPSSEAIFKPVRATPTVAFAAMASPYILTRREMLASRKALSTSRDELARLIGILASQGPRLTSESATSAQAALAVTPYELISETSRLYGVLCRVLDVPVTGAYAASGNGSSRRSRQSSVAHTPPSATPANLLSILTTHLPKVQETIDKTLTVHSRPSALTRLWFPLLFLPPAVYVTVQAISKNKEWMKEQVRNAKETIKGFVVQWVWEPLEGIGKTMRGGGEGLGVAPTTVQSDQASLERMVLDLGKDYYHMSPPELEALSGKIKAGDMEEVLRVYEKEMQNPLKNALMGSLIRTLLIQVQKTKTDLSLSLLSLDHLLRSQQLTFAFVGVAPSVLVLYGLGGWLSAVWKGEKRGKGRRRKYFNGLRDIEKTLLTAPENDHEMSEKDRGLLIVSVSGMRTWAAGLGSTREAFMDDIRLVENPSLTRADKLHVINRIWRCWGVDGRRPH